MNVLIDTSVWIDHLRRGNRELAALLEEGAVFTHPFVLGELACGRLSNRDEVLDLLSALPAVPDAEHEETLTFLEGNRLYESGIGWVDVHLLASARLVGCPIWTLDRKLQAVAGALGLQYGAT